jgi:hypothetical protein
VKVVLLVEAGLDATAEMIAPTAKRDSVNRRCIASFLKLWLKQRQTPPCLLSRFIRDRSHAVPSAMARFRYETQVLHTLTSAIHRQL